VGDVRKDPLGVETDGLGERETDIDGMLGVSLSQTAIVHCLVTPVWFFLVARVFIYSNLFGLVCLAGSLCCFQINGFTILHGSQKLNKKRLNGKILLYNFGKKSERNNAPVVISYRLMNHLDDMLPTQNSIFWQTCRLVLKVQIHSRCL